MAAQQTLIAETIRGMKVAMRRRSDCSDSDSSIDQHTNRSNKLKRNAAHVREGRLDTTGGRSYRRKIDHASYQRYIIHNNPARFDEDGDLVEDDDDEAGNASPDEENPFENTKLEYLLAPLTSAADLANHPSLSFPYTNKALTEMAENARDMLHRERETLWSMKQLLLRFRGDDMWIPLEKVETVHDDLLLDPDALDGLDSSDSSIHDSSMSIDQQIPAAVDIDAHTTAAVANGLKEDSPDFLFKEKESNGVASIDMAVEGKAVQKTGAPSLGGISEQGSLHDSTRPNLNGADHNRTMSNTLPDAQDAKEENGHTEAGDIDPGHVRLSIEPDSPSESQSGQPQHGMTTRAKARSPQSPVANASPSASPVPSSIPSISNFFIAAPTALPDRDFGLPAQEADDTRRLLLLYVQKQEEIVRGTEILFQGLLKAERSRKEVYSWCKAEGHVGELSDGEDWYDKEEWGLAEDLKKGKEEEEVEEEGGRKGRRRRPKVV